jgi:amino acid transporter
MLGIKISWPWCAAALLATGAFLGYRDIELSAKLLGFLMLAEVVVLLVFDISVITRGGRLSGSGFSFESFYPENIFTSAIGLGLLWGLGCFGGFEVGFMYSEEAREPEKTIPRATYLALALLVVFYTFTTWAVVNGYDGQNMQASVAQSMQGFLFSITTRYVGVFWTDLMRILVCTGYLAA